MKFPFQGWNLMAIVPTLQAEPLSVSPPNDHRNLFCATIEGSISPRGMLSTLPRTTLLSSRRNQFQQGPPQPQSLVNPVPEQAAPKYEPPEGYLLFSLVICCCLVKRDSTLFYELNTTNILPFQSATLVFFFVLSGKDSILIWWV